MRPITLALALPLALTPNPKSTEELTWRRSISIGPSFKRNDRAVMTKSHAIDQKAEREAGTQE